MRLYRPTWKAADGQRRKSPKWWLDFADVDGRRRRLPGLTDKRQTEALARNVVKLLAVRGSGDALPADLLQWLESVPVAFRERLADAGLLDRDRIGGIAPLLQVDTKGNVTGGHLADFLADAEARDVSVKQRRLMVQRIRDVLLAAKIQWVRNLSVSRVQAAIAAFGEPTPGRPDGLSKQTLCHYVRGVKQFSRWLHRERRTAEDMLFGVRGYNPETDKRHERRGFTADEMAVLLPVTRRASTRWGMTGPARAAAYILAFASGLRRNEIRTLTRASFNLDADSPTVTVLAAYSKHRRTDVQPLPGPVAASLAGYLADADAERPFPLPDKTGAMVHQDMSEARAVWIAEARSEAERENRRSSKTFLAPRDPRGLVLDFHSFRHGYVTEICKAPISPRAMMALARHTDPRLTLKRYSRLTGSETAAALDALPSLGGDSTAKPAKRRAIGGDDVA